MSTRKWHDEYYKKGAKNDTRSNQPWSSEDTNKILAEDRPTDMELARQLGRTVKAIELRRFAVTHGLRATGGVVKSKGHGALPAATRAAKPPVTHLGAVIRAAALGLRFSEEASTAAIMAAVDYYRPLHELGIKPGCRLRVKFCGMCEVVEVHVRSRQATVRLPSDETTRRVPLEDLKRAAYAERRSTRRGKR